MAMQQHQSGRREFVKKAAYAAPIILTLRVAPSYAKAGSEKEPKEPKPREPKPIEKLDAIETIAPK